MKESNAEKQKGVFMYLSLSKTIAKFGGMRLRMGIRITKKNAWYMLWILMFAYMLQACWYMLILCGWLTYALFYGMYWCIKKLILAIKQKQH